MEVESIWIFTAQLFAYRYWLTITTHPNQFAIYVISLQITSERKASYWHLHLKRIYLFPGVGSTATPTYGHDLAPDHRLQKLILTTRDEANRAQTGIIHERLEDGFWIVPFVSDQIARAMYFSYWIDSLLHTKLSPILKLEARANIDRNKDSIWN